MTREVLGTDLTQPDDGSPPLVDIDLGELAHELGPDDREPRVPLAERVTALVQRWRRLGWRAAVGVALVAICAAAVGWQVSADRNRATAATHPAAKPMVLAWLSYNGPDPDSRPGQPNASLEVHLANFGTTTLQLSSVSSTVDSGAVTARLLPGQPVQIIAGQTTTTVIQIHTTCVSNYGKASLDLGVTPLAQTGVSPQETEIQPVSDSQLGASYEAILNELCQDAVGGGSAAGGLDGVYFEQESDSTGSSIILTNRASTNRRVTFSAANSDGFRLQANPSTTLVLQPGENTSVRLVVKVVNCRSIGRLSNWAQTANLSVAGGDSSFEGVGSEAGPAEVGISNAVLAPAGGAVQKACG
jgi:hypothetical protein